MAELVRLELGRDQPRRHPGGLDRAPPARRRLAGDRDRHLDPGRACCVRRRRIPFIAVNTLTGALYTIPSLAMFAFLLSVVGIGFEPAVIALAVYCLQLIIRNSVVGLEGVSGPVREAAKGMGLTSRQTLMRVELPLALPAIFAGIRLAAVSTVGIATIAVYIGARRPGRPHRQRRHPARPVRHADRGRRRHRHGHGHRHRPARSSASSALLTPWQRATGGSGLMGDILGRLPARTTAGSRRGSRSSSPSRPWASRPSWAWCSGIVCAKVGRAAAFLGDHGLEPRPHGADVRPHRAHPGAHRARLLARRAGPVPARRSPRSCSTRSRA